MRYLLTGVSVRALAQSALRAGYEVAAVDHFGDRDLSGLTESRSLLQTTGGPYNAMLLPGLAAGMAYDALVYVSNLENHPEVVRTLAADRPVCGNTPETLDKARHWPTLRRVCAEEGVAMPATLFPGEEPTAAPGVDWLRKPVKSGGGHAIRPWDGLVLEAGWYVQARTPGVDASAVFAADGERAVVLGLCEQLIGDAAFGAAGYRHCGNIFPLAPERGGTPALRAAVQDMAGRLTRRFGLRGICGLDFMAAPGPDGAFRPVLIEINPRPTASAELLEAAGLGGIFAMHVKAVAGELPAAPYAPAPGCWAKGIVFARKPVTIPRDDGWITPGLCDLGQPGASIAAGRPICTVLVQGPDRLTTLETLSATALAVRRALDSNGRKQ